MAASLAGSPSPCLLATAGARGDCTRVSSTLASDVCAGSCVASRAQLCAGVCASRWCAIRPSRISSRRPRPWLSVLHSLGRAGVCHCLQPLLQGAAGSGRCSLGGAHVLRYRVWWRIPVGASRDDPSLSSRGAIPRSRCPAGVARRTACSCHGSNRRPPLETTRIGASGSAGRSRRAAVGSTSAIVDGGPTGAKPVRRATASRSPARRGSPPPG